MKKPEISVILSTYNRDYKPFGMDTTYLERAVNSVLQQTFSDYELILINDGSKDSSHETCLRFAANDSRIRYVHHDKNSGLPAQCYNEGIALSKGFFLAFMFDDDYWFSNALQDLHNFFCEKQTLHPSLRMVYGLVEFFNAEKNVMIHPSFGGEWNLYELRTANYLANCSVLLRRDALDLVGGYDEHLDMRRICDWDLWLRMGMVYTVLRLPTLIGSLNATVDGSLEKTIHLDMEKVRARQQGHRILPLAIRKPTIFEKLCYVRSKLNLWYCSLIEYFRGIKIFIRTKLNAMNIKGKIVALTKKCGCYNFLKRILC